MKFLAPMLLLLASPAFSSEAMDYSALDDLNAAVDESGCSTDQECDDLVRSLLSQAVLERSADAGIMIERDIKPGEELDYGEVVDGILESADKGKLYDSEKVLFNESPYKGLKSLWYGNKANNATIDLFVNTAEVLHNGNGDAFRHAYWNALMVRYIDLQWARRWAFAHEDWPGNPKLEKLMDSNNNMSGQQIGGHHPDFGEDDLKQTAINWLNAGALRRMAPGVDYLLPSNATGKL